MNVLPRSKLAMAIRAGSVLLMASLGSTTHAYELYQEGETTINTDFEAVLALFHSEQSYAISGTRHEGSSQWQEGYLKYGASLTQGLGNGGDQVYGALNWLSSATFGDGDAAGFTNGSERTTKVEDAYLGWRSGTLFPALGENGVDASFGRQKIVVGDGFLISGDALNLGDEIAPDGSLDRGGAYYLAARQAFDRTAVLRLGGDKGLRGDLMWLRSDNRAQGEAEMAVATLEHVNDQGTVGLTYIDVLDTNADFDSVGRGENKTYSLRYQGNAGVENLFLSGEFARQDTAATDEHAWYLEAGWTFADVAWSPSVNYRYSRFSESYDALFYGNGRAMGTWFQGEVAANYARPFNSNTRVHHVGIKASPTETLTIGALAYKFETLSRDGGLNLDATELDIYAEWAAMDNLFVVPVIGLFKPEASANNGGTQIGNNDTNVYAQLIFATGF